MEHKSVNIADYAVKWSPQLQSICGFSDGLIAGIIGKNDEKESILMVSYKNQFYTDTLRLSFDEMVLNQIQEYPTGNIQDLPFDLHLNDKLEDFNYISTPLKTFDDKTAAFLILIFTRNNNQNIPPEKYLKQFKVFFQSDLVYNNIQNAPSVKSYQSLIERYKLIFDSARDSIIIINFEGIILEINSATSEKLGLKREQLIGNPIQLMFRNNDKDHLAHMIKNIVSEGENITEFKVLKPNGEIFISESRAKVITFDNQPAIITVNRDISERKKEQKAILHSSIQAEITERERVAQELHDGVSPILSAAKLYIQSLQLKSEDKMNKIIQQKSEKTINEAIRVLGEISANLNPFILKEFGLQKAIFHFAQKIKDTTKIHMHIETSIITDPGEIIATSLYRISIELINNAIKHSMAKNITLLLSSEKVVTLVYMDDGIGFDFTKENYEGHGLKNMQHRVKTLNGKISFESKNSFGVKITIQIPLET